MPIVLEPSLSPIAPEAADVIIPDSPPPHGSGIPPIPITDFLTDVQALGLSYEHVTQTGGDIVFVNFPAPTDACAVSSKYDKSYFIVHEKQRGQPQPFVLDQWSWYGDVKVIDPGYPEDPLDLSTTSRQGIPISNANLVPRPQNSVPDYRNLLEKYFDIYSVRKFELIQSVRAQVGEIDSACSSLTIRTYGRFMDDSLNYFNGIATFTDFTWDNLPTRWYRTLIEGAYLFAIASLGLIEKGREFTFSDNGLSFEVPKVADYLMGSLHAARYQGWKDDVDKIKLNIKPKPTGLGTFQPLLLNPTLMRLRHLRERRLI